MRCDRILERFADPGRAQVAPRCACLAIATSLAFAANGGIAAQETIEEIVVTAKTGSRIGREGDSPSPLSNYDGRTMREAGLRDLRDLVGVVAINAGAENNSDNLTQNFTVGTANINLRGLGVASTLVLLNGRRQVLSAVQTDDGSSFVDLAALVPALAIERVEILKDGATAIYGSEAVAGVANFITRRGFEGIEVEAEYRSRTGNGSQDDITLDGVVGGKIAGGGEFLLAASYLDRTSLVLIEVDWLRPATSGFGNPGSFNVPSLGRTVADPGCEQYAGLLQNLANGGAICRFDYGPQITAIPNEQRAQAWGRAEWPWSDTATVWAEFGHARNDISRDVSPSFPVLNTPRVPAYHPGNTYGEDVWFQGRPYGYGAPPEINYYQHDTSRAAIGANGRLANGMSWDTSIVRAVNDALLNPRDVIAANFQAALLGFGGSGCNPDNTPPGQGGCLFFNPFSSTFAASPGDPLFNAPELRQFIIGDYFGDGESALTTYEANLTGFIPAFGGAYAVGAQYRNQTLDFSYDSITRQDGFAFLIGNSNYAAHDDVFAAYGEVWLPLPERIEATFALRYEDYGDGTGDTLDPKVTLLLRATEALSVRGSFSTSFRAPSPFQTRGVQTNFTNIVDHDGSRTFAGRRTLGDPNLQPEISRAVNIGATWRDARRAFSADLWRYTFEDVLRKENAQAIVNADPFDPRVERTSRRHDLHSQRRLHQRRFDRDLRHRPVRARQPGRGRRTALDLARGDLAAVLRRDQRRGGDRRPGQTQPRQRRRAQSAVQRGRQRRLVPRRCAVLCHGTTHRPLRGRRQRRDRGVHDTGCQRPLVPRRTGPRGIGGFHHAGHRQPVRPGPSPCRHRRELRPAVGGPARTQGVPVTRTGNLGRSNRPSSHASVAPSTLFRFDGNAALSLRLRVQGGHVGVENQPHCFFERVMASSIRACSRSSSWSSASHFSMSSSLYC